jgi:hypothetical protein
MAKAKNTKPSQLVDLIRGEMAAVKTYDTALDKVKDLKEAEKLQMIRKDHVTAVEKLKTFENKEALDDETIKP